MHLKAAGQRIWQQKVPCAIPACAMVLPADKLAWPACGQPCLCVNRTVSQKLTGTGCIDGG